MRDGSTCLVIIIPITQCQCCRGNTSQLLDNYSHSELTVLSIVAEHEGVPLKVRSITEYVSFGQ